MVDSKVQQFMAIPQEVRFAVYALTLMALMGVVCCAISIVNNRFNLIIVISTFIVAFLAILMSIGIVRGRKGCWYVAIVISIVWASTGIFEVLCGAGTVTIESISASDSMTAVGALDFAIGVLGIVALCPGAVRKYCGFEVRD